MSQALLFVLFVQMSLELGLPPGVSGRVWTQVLSLSLNPPRTSELNLAPPQRGFHSPYPQTSVGHVLS